MGRSRTVHIALGSNLGDSAGYLRAAATRLAGDSAGEVRGSSIWITEPVGFDRPVPDFCNAVMLMATRQTPEALLAHLQDVERSMGRTGAGRSRTLDLDIIDFDGRVVADTGLVLPHPRAHRRRFVLLPLREVSPGFRFPDRDASLGDLLRQAPALAARKSSPLIPWA